MMSIALHIKDQEQRWWQKEQSFLQQVNLEMEAAYEFVANFKLSAWHNASIALSTMPSGSIVVGPQGLPSMT
jgi:hypothetical protein